jgi:hypothetical protein
MATLHIIECPEVSLATPNAESPLRTNEIRALESVGLAAANSKVRAQRQPKSRDSSGSKDSSEIRDSRDSTDTSESTDSRESQ